MRLLLNRRHELQVEEQTRLAELELIREAIHISGDVEAPRQLAAIRAAGHLPMVRPAQPSLDASSDSG